MAYATAKEHNIDLIVASEPNKKLSQTRGWIADEDKDVAVLFINSNIKVSKIGTKKGIVSISTEAFDIHGCYISPNISIQSFEEYINILREVMSQGNRKALVMGDFNAKSYEWGAPVTDRRGEIMGEIIAEADLIVHNTGGKPTFERRGQKSYIDLTLTTRSLASKLRNWQILENEPLTPHKHIVFEIMDATPKKTDIKGKVFINNEKFRKKIRDEIKRARETKITAEILANIIKHCYNAAKVGKPNKNSAPYWWNKEISKQREQCIKSRRMYTRNASADAGDAILEKLWEEYKKEKKELAEMIIKEKSQQWDKLIDDLNEDVWGEGYQIIKRKFKDVGPPFKLTDQKIKEITDVLFPRRKENLMTPIYTEEVPLFEIEEIRKACGKLKPGKAPGPDGIPSEAIKETVNEAPEMIQRVMNELLIQQNFPEPWKISKLVLIHKAGKAYDAPNGYRPLCLSDTLAKLYEHLIKERLEREITEREGISPNQYGFRKGRSTVDAVKMVMDIAKETKSHGTGERWCALITIDVRNAFNSASWQIILERLGELRIPQYLKNVVRDYLNHRAILAGKETINLSAGIPQGSVLGPLLWNVYYDSVLKLKLEGVTAVGYADDVGLTITARNKTDLTEKANEALDKIDGWMKQNKLELAPEKTESVILCGKRDRKDVKFNINGTEIIPKKAVRYLGIMIGENMAFGEHVKTIVQKASEKTTNINILMTNKKGPSTAKRRLLYGVIQSTLLYGVPAWGEVVKIGKYKNMLIKAQRKAILRVANAYRTVSNEALQVIAGTPPIDLVIDERLFLERNGNTKEQRDNAKEVTIEKWQERWERDTGKAIWTKRLIPNIKQWMECQHRYVNYQITQILTNHGCFKVYTKRIGKTISDRCMYCMDIDDAYHTMINCPKFREKRNNMLEALHIDKENVLPEQIIAEMLKNKENWKVGNQFIREIMDTKSKDEHSEQTIILE